MTRGISGTGKKRTLRESGKPYAKIPMNVSAGGGCSVSECLMSLNQNEIGDRNKTLIKPTFLLKNKRNKVIKYRKLPQSREIDNSEDLKRNFKRHRLHCKHNYKASNALDVASN